MSVSGADADLSRKPLPPEAELLLLVAAGKSQQPRFERLVRSPLDWPLLTRMAFQAQATTALWKRIEATAGFTPPPDAAQLQSLAVLNEFRLIHVKDQLERLLTLLAENGFEVLLIKGAALLAGATSRPIERTMSDLDLVIVKGSAEEAWKRCRAAGWEPSHADLTEEVYRRHHHLPPLRDPDGVSLSLELHRSLFLGGGELLGIDDDSLIRRSREIRVGNATGRVPSLEDSLLYACVHFGWGHGFQHHGWSTFADAHAITTDPGFSWPRFLQVVSATRAGSYCYWTLRLARTATRLPVPQDVLNQLPGPSSRWLGSALERHLLRSLFDRQVAELPVRLHQFLWNRLARPGRSGLGNVRPWTLDSPHVERPPRPKPMGDNAAGRRWPRSIQALIYVIGLVVPSPRKA